MILDSMSVGAILVAFLVQFGIREALKISKLDERGRLPSSATIFLNIINYLKILLLRKLRSAPVAHSCRRIVGDLTLSLLL